MTTAERLVLTQAIVLAEHIRRTDIGVHEEQFVGLKLAVDAYMLSIPSPVNPPLEVRRAIVHKFLDSPGRAESILATLSFDGNLKCYGFQFANMFHGVEPDGYIHT